VNVAGVFGDIFDVIYAYPDVKKWRTIDAYPVVIVAGDIDLTAAEGERLAQYVERGGTLLLADAHLTGPGREALDRPQTGAEAETCGYRWLGSVEVWPSQVFRFKEIVSPADTKTAFRPLATTPDGKVFCAAIDRGAGRLIYLAVPRGLGIDQAAHPVLPRLFAHLTRGLMPIEVQGDVNWLVNRTQTDWLVTLLNPAGQDKPQQGITPTDYRQNRVVTIISHVAFSAARDRLLPDDALQVETDRMMLEVPAGSVRIVEIK
jgi:hypothetical protein